MLDPNPIYTRAGEVEAAGGCNAAAGLIEGQPCSCCSGPY